MMVEDVSLDDSPLRDAPVLVARVRCGKGASRCSRCGRKAPRYDNGGGGRSWRHQDFGCFRVELSGPVPRVECRPHGVVVSRVPWAEPGGRFTRDFESGCAWLMTVAGQKTVSGFPHIAWRTAGDIARRVAGRPESSMPCMFDGLHAIGVDETGRGKGHAYITVIVDHGRGRVIWAHDGHGGQVLGLFFRQLTPKRNSNDGSAGRPAAASPRSSNHAGRSADAATTSSQPSGSAIPTPGSKRSTTRSRSPSAWPTASATRTTSSP